MRRVGYYLLLLCVGISVTGCWNRTELNEIGITTATGVDWTGKEWILTYQLIVPSSMSSGTGGTSATSSQSTIHTFSTQGSSLPEAIGKGNLEHPRRLYFSHNNVMIIGKKAAEKGVSEIIDLYFRTSEFRETVKVAVTNGEAREILRKLMPPEKLPGKAISDILRKQEKSSGYYPSQSIYDVAFAINSDANAVGIPEISISREQKGSHEQKLESVDEFGETYSQVKIRLTRLGVFRGERLVGYMREDESLGLAIMKGSIENATLSFTCKNSNGLSNKSAFKIKDLVTKTKPEKNGDHFVIQLKVKFKGDLREVGCPADTTNPDGIQVLQSQLEKEVEAYIYKAWGAIRRLKTDLPGFADKIHRKYPKEWRERKENWEDELTRMELKVHVEGSILRPGLLQKSIGNSEKDD